MTNLDVISNVNVGMLIRKPVNEVFEAFVDPAITTKFWFTKSNGRLEMGKRICWDWEMYGVSAKLEVKEIEQDKRIVVQFDDDTTAEWIFTPRESEGTFVEIKNYGFKGNTSEVVNQVVDSTGGYTIVLCGLKALLEHNIALNLVADKFPDANV